MRFPRRQKIVTWNDYHQRRMARLERGPGAGILHTLLFATALVTGVFLA